MAFSELEKRKHKIFLEKLRNIEQKPYGASLSANIQSGVRDSGFVTEQLSGNWKHFFFCSIEDIEIVDLYVYGFIQFLDADISFIKKIILLKLWKLYIYYN